MSDQRMAIAGGSMIDSRTARQVVTVTRVSQLLEHASFEDAGEYCITLRSGLQVKAAWNTLLNYFERLFVVGTQEARFVLEPEEGLPDKPDDKKDDTDLGDTLQTALFSTITPTSNAGIPLHNICCKTFFVTLNKSPIFNEDGSCKDCDDVAGTAGVDADCDDIDIDCDHDTGTACVDADCDNAGAACDDDEVGSDDDTGTDCNEIGRDCVEIGRDCVDDTGAACDDDEDDGDLRKPLYPHHGICGGSVSLCRHRM
ncbi:hypothetical protein K492DRAFT_200615 [Lichtheimia hyalospora FSU 10163]|nr:hypothetical protein K492DRAFT_200615 [Lichtheimia hyalospora FSU 10163]